MPLHDEMLRLSASGAHSGQSGGHRPARQYVTPVECKPSPASGCGHSHVLLARDETESVRREGDTEWETRQLLIGLPPDRRTEHPHRFFSGSGCGAASDRRDPPLRALSDDGGLQHAGPLPAAARRRDSSPSRRPSRFRQPQHPLVLIWRELVYDDVALHLRVGVDDSHREYRRRAIEQSLRRKCSSSQSENALRTLQPHTVVRDELGTTEKCDDVSGGVGIGENKTRVHTF